MRKVALMMTAGLLAAVSVAFAAPGSAALKPGLTAALAKTSGASSVHYELQVEINKHGMPLALRVRGQSDAKTISIHLQTAGTTGTEMIDGPFLYEQAPAGVTVNGNVRWLRTPLSQVPANSSALAAIRALTPPPLLSVIGRAQLRAVGSEYVGTVAYDDPVVRSGLTHLTGGIEFRGLRLVVHVEQDGMIHRFQLTGETADGLSTFKLKALLYSFGKPVHVTPPKPGTFIDQQLAALTE